ncbi:MAG: hypothetical protein SOZ66_00425 [Candidatus Cryptobacteroides sp.]|nr:hypothetical protein [Candidatus Cryptobacteroides sp.]
MRAVNTILAGLMLYCLPCAAQFYVAGSDKGSLKWRSIRTLGWEVIYPEGCDSLAREYARTLEEFRPLVGAGTPYMPNSEYRRPMPVILHSRSAISNGMVSWSPRRMELYTTPSSCPLESSPWMKLLAIHESRHVTQMQFAAARPFRALNVLSGELWAGAASALYCGPAFLEGDAVACETALSPGGRGRSAEFLEYWKACNLEGQKRSWWQWRYGSTFHYTPDYYRAGYVMMGGMKAVFNDSLFVQRYYERIAKQGLPLFNLQKTIREGSGLSLKKAMEKIDSALSDTWQVQANSNLPFTVSKPICEISGSYVSYSEPCVTPFGVFAVRRSLDRPSSLVLIPTEGDAPQKRICAFAGNTGRMSYSPSAGRLFWSEVIPDLRWEQESFSELRFCDLKGRKRTLVGGRRLYNPAASTLGNELAAVEYLGNGEERVVVFDASDGRELRGWKVPAGLQVCELAWTGSTLHAIVLSEEGMGIRLLPSFSVELRECHVMLGSLNSFEDCLTFCSDRNGTSEIYEFRPTDGRLRKLTSSKTASKAGTLTPKGLLFLSTGTQGTIPHFSKREELRFSEEDWNERYRWEWAEKLSGRESPPSGEVNISSPEPYSKWKHLLNVHSWIPVYVNADDIATASLENITQTAWLGATAFFQNHLGTFYGSAAAKLMQNVLPSDKDKPWGSAMAKLCYRGFFPVLEAELHVGESYSRHSWLTSLEDGRTGSEHTDTGRPFVSSRFRAYVPLNFSSGGWIRGLVGSLSWSLSNDIINTSVVSSDPVFDIVRKGRQVISNSATASVRWYSMRPVAHSCIYPRLGAGIEGGVRIYPGLDGVHEPVSYIHSYAYLPGLGRSQGLRLSLKLQHQSGESLLHDSVAVSDPYGLGLPFRGHLRADYAIPFAALDCDLLCPVAYIRNLEATLHCDLTSCWGEGLARNFARAGADLAVRLANLAWIPYDTRVGVSWDHSLASGKNVFSLLFTIDM